MYGKMLLNISVSFWAATLIVGCQKLQEAETHFAQETLSAPNSGTGPAAIPGSQHIQFIGRWDVVTDPANPSTAWPGTGLTARFTGTTSVKAMFTEDNGNNRIWVRINGGNPVTIRLPRGTSTQTLASGLSASSNHSIEIWKKTEGCCGAGKFTFKGFVMDAGASILQPQSTPTLRLDFYGDSHAAGYSAECTCDNGDTRYKNAYYSYPAITARLLGATFHNQSWSGIGIHSGYATITMMQAYTQTLQTFNNPIWDFSKYEVSPSVNLSPSQPNVIVVQLGDNDVYKGSTPAQISQALKNFVTNELRVKHPEAVVILAATVGWDKNEVANYIETVASDLGGSGNKVYALKLPWFSGQEHRVYCEQISHAKIVADKIAEIATQAGWTGWQQPSGAAEYSMGCLPEQAVPGQPVELKNNGFESPLTIPATNGVADGWRSFVTTGSIAAVRTMNDAAAGSSYLRLTPAKSGYAGIYQAVEIPHVPVGSTGVYVKATAKMRNVSGTAFLGKLRIEFRDQSQNLISQVDGLKNLSSSWNLYATTSGPAPAGTWHIRVVCVSDGGCTVDYDAITLTTSTVPF